jgi:hypothetical protein
MGFFPAVLTVTAGTKAGEPFELLPWHQFAVGSLFGRVKDSGRLRFRRAWLAGRKSEDEDSEFTQAGPRTILRPPRNPAPQKRQNPPP